MASEGVLSFPSTSGSGSSTPGLDPSAMGEINSWFSEANAMDDPTVDILAALPEEPDPRRAAGITRIITNLFRVIAGKLTTVWSVVIAINNKVEGLKSAVEEAAKERDKVSKQIDRLLKLTAAVDGRVGETEVALIERIDLAEKEIVKVEKKWHEDAGKMKGKWD